MNSTNKQLPAILGRKMRSDAVLFYFLIYVSHSLATLSLLYTLPALVTPPSQLWLAWCCSVWVISPHVMTTMFKTSDGGHLSMRKRRHNVDLLSRRINIFSLRRKEILILWLQKSSVQWTISGETKISIYARRDYQILTSRPSVDGLRHLLRILESIPLR